MIGQLIEKKFNDLWYNIFKQSIISYNKSIQDYKLVITGGKALTRYFELGYFDISYDWDLKLINNGKQPKEEALNIAGNYIRNTIRYIIENNEFYKIYIDNLLTSLTTVTGLQFSQPEEIITSQLRKSRINKSLTVYTIYYNYIVNNIKYTNTIMDIVIQDKEYDIKLENCLELYSLYYIPLDYIYYKLVEISNDKNNPHRGKNKERLGKFIKGMKKGLLTCQIFANLSKLYNYNFPLNDYFTILDELEYKDLLDQVSNLAIFRKLSCINNILLGPLAQPSSIIYKIPSKIINYHYKWLIDNDPNGLFKEYTRQSYVLNKGLMKNWLLSPDTNYYLHNTYWNNIDIKTATEKMITAYPKINENLVPHKTFKLYKVTKYFNLRNQKFATPDDFQIGQILYQPCFNSTSFERNFNFEWFFEPGSPCCGFIINISEEDLVVCVSKYSAFPDQDEVILPPTCSFEIISKSLSYISYLNENKVPIVAPMYIFEVNFIMPDLSDWSQSLSSSSISLSNDLSSYSSNQINNSSNVLRVGSRSNTYNESLYLVDFYPLLFYEKSYTSFYNLLSDFYDRLFIDYGSLSSSEILAIKNNLKSKPKSSA